MDRGGGGGGVGLAFPVAQMERWFVPKILVVSSPDSAALWESSYNTPFAEAMTQYSKLHFGTKTQKVPMRTIDGQSNDISDFQVEFLESGGLVPYDFSPEHTQGVQRRLRTMVGEGAPKGDRYGGEGVRERKDLPRFMHDFQRKFGAGKGRREVIELPWFVSYRDAIIQSIGASDHEFFSHPIMALVLVSCRERAPVEKCLEIASKGTGLPPAVRHLEEVLGNTIQHHYVLLHDSRDDQKLCDKVQAEIVKNFGAASTSVLRVRLAGDGASLSSLGSDDRARINTFITDLCRNRVIPLIDGAMRPLHESVSSSRKSFKGLRAWLRPFSGAPSPPQPSSRGEGIGVAVMTRRLADYLFFLKDYENALQNYKLCQADFKAEKQWKMYAGACEMIGVLMFLLDPTNKVKETEIELDRAYCYYTRKGKGRECGARTTFLLASVLLSSGKHLDATAVYMRAASRSAAAGDHLGAAVFYEQAALCYMKMRFPRFRKCKFALVLAADQFNEVNLPQHAMGCYLAANAVYRDRGWKRIDNHLDHGMVEQCYSLNLLPQACTHAKQLIDQTVQPIGSQASHFREFIHLFNLLNNQNPTKIPIFPLPKINLSTLLVYFNSSYAINQRGEGGGEGGGRGVGGGGEGGLGEGGWGEMEKMLESDDVKALAQIHCDFERRYDVSYLSVEAQSIPAVSVVNEYVHVDIEMVNPLLIPIQLEKVQLLCTHQTREEGGEPGEREGRVVEGEGGVVELRREEDHLDAQLPIADKGTVFTETFDIFLRADFKKKVRLKLVPLKEGVVRIRGVGFIVANKVWARTPLYLPPRRLVKNREQSKGYFYEEDRSLTFNVTSAMPYLLARFQNFPKYLLQGEIRQLTLEVTNRGKMDLKNLRVAVTHPALFVFGKATKTNNSSSPPQWPSYHSYHEQGKCGEKECNFGEPHSFCEYLNKERYRGEESTMGTTDDYPLPSSSSSSSSSRVGVVHFPGVTLASGESLLIPVFIRSSLVGQFQTHFLWYYEPKVPNEHMPHRVLRLEEKVTITPSLKIEKMTTWSSSGLSSYILSLELINPQPDAKFRLKQLTTSSSAWTITPLSYNNNDNNTTNNNKNHQYLEFEPAGEKKEEEKGGLYEIAPKESTTLHFRVTPSDITKMRRWEREDGRWKEEGGEEWDDISLGEEGKEKEEKGKEGREEKKLLTYLSFGGPVVDCSQAPFFSFVEKEKREIFNLTHRTLPTGRGVPDIRDGLNQNKREREEVNDQRRLDVIVFWETVGGQRFGQSNVLNLHLSPLSLAPTKEVVVAQAKNPLLILELYKSSSLRFLVDVPPIIEHDFSEESFCVVGVTIRVENCDTNLPLSFTFETLKPHERSPHYSIGKRGQYVWSGKTFYTIRDLKPVNQVELYTEVCFSGAGVYNINRFKFVVTSKETKGKPLVLFSPFQWMVCVRDTAQK